MATVNDKFYLYQGNSFDLISMDIDNTSDINFVSRTSENNGVVAKVKKIVDKKPFPAGLITVALGGSVLSSFVQTEPFYTGYHIMVLEPKEEMTFQEKMFYALCINKNAYRYSYGRQANKTLKNIIIPDSVPDWLINYKINTSILETNNNSITLNKNNWDSFLISELFDVCGTKTTSVEDLNSYGHGEFPYVTTQSSNNGINGYYNYFTENGNVLVIDSAVVGYCSYQEKNFSASDHVEKLIPKFKLNKYIALFLVTIINNENYKYSYGRKFNQTKIKNTVIHLPVTDLGKPDWNYMEQYIKSLPYADKI